MDFDPDVFLSLLHSDFNVADNDEVRNFARNHMLRSILKKYPSCSPDQLHRECQESFLGRNDAVANHEVPQTFKDTMLCGLWRDELSRFFDTSDGVNPISFHRIVPLGYTGPGASIGPQKNDFYTKMFNSDLTYTNLSLYRWYTTFMPDAWAMPELIRRSLWRTCTVVGSKYSSVPKDKTKNRSIAIEPSLNMFFQLGVKVVLNRLLKQKFGLTIEKSSCDPSDQQLRNRQLAREGSLHGKLCTLDLRDASDMISIELCKLLLPREIFEVLYAISSRFIVIDGKEVKLNMISTMGNGFTFSLMTVMLHSLTRAAARLHGLQLTRENAGTYGDDLIFPTELLQTVAYGLTSAGLVVNFEKSFSTGFFRESCGGDYYLGRDVRGVYLKDPCNENTQIYSIFNRLHHWAVSHGISCDRSLSYLLRLTVFNPVPYEVDVRAGFKIPSSILTSPKRDLNGCILYKSWEPLKELWRVPVNCNYPGAVQSLLGGYIRDGSVGIRSHRVVYRLTRHVTPRWDYMPDAGLIPEVWAISWRRLLRGVA